MKNHTWIAAALVAGFASGIPAVADAQVWKKVKQGVSQKLDARKKKADSTVVQAATGAVDSTLASGNRAVDAGATRVGAAAGAAVNRTERGVANALKGGRGSDAVADQVAADLTSAGRAMVPELEFAPGSAELEPSSESVLKDIAKVLKASESAYLIEGHVDATGDATANQALSEQRAGAVKKRLVALGVPAARLFASGYGATRPLAAAAALDSASAGGAMKAPSKADMAKSVAQNVVPGARLIGLGARALKAHRGRHQADQADAGATAPSNARIEIVRMQ